MKELFGWSDNLSTGNDEIDRQHKELITGIQKLLGAITEHQGSGSQESMNEAMDLIDFLEDYVVRHFRYEEELMEEYDCPSKDINKEQHTIFIHKFSNIKRLIERKGVTRKVVLKLEALLCNWLIKHIQEVDSKLDGLIITEQPKFGGIGKIWRSFFGK